MDSAHHPGGWIARALVLGALAASAAACGRAAADRSQAASTLPGPAPRAAAQQTENPPDEGGKDESATGRTEGSPETPDTPPRVEREGDTPPDETRRDFDGDCLRGGCHARLAEAPRLHGPVAVGACGACHAPVGAVDEHRFEPARPRETLCAHCHRPEAAEEHVHEAYATGECTGCHDPHGGEDRRLLASTDEAALCGACHAPTHAPPSEPGEASGEPAERPGEERAGEATEEAADTAPTSREPPRGPPYPALHEPVEEGKCLVCHAPHQSPRPALLVRAERELCLGCHQPVSDRLTASPHPHEALSEGCVRCHAPHGAQDPSLLQTEARTLCLSCHADAVARGDGDGDEAATGAGSGHATVLAEASCLACHRAHESQVPALLATPIGERCLACHGAGATPAPGPEGPDVASELADAAHRHGPVSEGRCDDCHYAHDSPHRALLKAALSDGPYAPFSEDTYALCFTCHDPRIVTEESTTRTGFRDGTRNLHRVHVAREKGRACGLCHASHASEAPALIRRSVPFGPGDWELPIGFRRTDEGGSCGPGCHRALSYDHRTPPGDPGAGLRPAPERK